MPSNALFLFLEKNSFGLFSFLLSDMLFPFIARLGKQLVLNPISSSWSFQGAVTYAVMVIESFLTTPYLDLSISCLPYQNTVNTLKAKSRYRFVLASAVVISLPF